MSRNNPTRRTAVKTLGVVGASLVLASPALTCDSGITRRLKLGVIADLHGGFATDAKFRLDAFLTAMQGESCDALVQLGDFAYPNRAHQEYADRFNAAHEKTLHVIGNHEFDHGLTREDCYQAWGIEASYYRTDVGGLRMIVLDGNETGSPKYKGGYPSYIGDGQVEWLASELDKSDKPVMILSHQPLAGVSAIDNANDIQELLSQYQSKIVLCLNGHSHVDSLIQAGGVSYLHVNSASYFWVGGKARTAVYTDPLFATITIDPEPATVSITGKTSTWKHQSPRELGYFERENAPAEAIVTPQIRNHRVSKTHLKVMTWNIWGRLNQEPRYTVQGKTARERTIEIIRESQADVVAMIETYGSAADIAEALNFHYHTPSADANLCLFSRYPLSDIELLEGLNPFSFIGATVTMPGGQSIRIYDIWLTSGGRHIVEIKNKDVPDEEFARGDDLRNEHLKELLTHKDFRKHLANSEAVPVVVAGDFNCVSHLDHSEATRQAGLNQARALPIKASTAMLEAGFTDAWRAANPGITSKNLGHTWTTVGMGYMYEEGKGFVPVKDNPQPQYRDPYARIDYIYFRGSRLQVLNSAVITHHPDQSTRSFPEFPSDHAAVVATFEVRQNR